MFFKRYDISNNVWSDPYISGVALIASTVAGRATVGIDGNIYITTDTNVFIHRFDPITESVVYDTDLPQRRDYGMFFTMDNYLYFMGGGTNGQSVPYGTDSINVAFIDSCESKGLINHFNWNTRTVLPSYYNNTITVNTNDLSISINIDLDYLGYSYNQYNQYGYGIVYVLSFISYDSTSLINEPSIECGENRVSSSFEELSSWSDYWKYSDNLILNNIDYNAYGPTGDHWILSESQTNECGINYFGTFKLYKMIII